MYDLKIIDRFIRKFAVQVNILYKMDLGIPKYFNFKDIILII